MMLARRSLGLNYSAMQYDDEFRVFCKIILTYLYVKEDVEINEELIKRSLMIEQDKIRSFLLTLKALHFDSV